ncbi:MAG: SRPBCC family protein [Candidatus Abawacabacteria bacterium]|nr:SRPBCC family protein [Candidatus Abawacabacteria bacterium]
MAKSITVEISINAPVEKVWQCWVEPAHICQWLFAQDDWECPEAHNDLRVGGRFSSTMRAKDLSSSFDFTGQYTDVQEHKIIEYTIDDGRKVQVVFSTEGDGTKIVETFEMENTHSEEQQRTGWQAILDNFKKYVESLK